MTPTKEYATAIVPAIDALRDLIAKHREDILSEFPETSAGYARRGVGFSIRDTLTELDHLRAMVMLAQTGQ